MAIQWPFMLVPWIQGSRLVFQEKYKLQQFNDQKLEPRRIIQRQMHSTRKSLTWDIGSSYDQHLLSAKYFHLLLLILHLNGQFCSTTGCWTFKMRKFLLESIAFGSGITKSFLPMKCHWNVVVYDMNNYWYFKGNRGIDAPESKMPYGQEAKEELVKLVQGKCLKVLVFTEDRYGRSVGDVYSNGIFVQVKPFQLFDFLKFILLQ